MNTIQPDILTPVTAPSNDNAAMLLNAVRLNKGDIGRIMDVQSAIQEKLKNTPQEIFLKKRGVEDYEFILDHGGAVFGVEDNNGQLIGATCVNNAINKGRVEVKINDGINPNQIAVLQGTMTHPDVWGQPHRLADILYLQRMNWIAQQDKTHVYTSVCCSALRINPNNAGEQEPIGNWRVINGLKKKGFVEEAVTSIDDRAGLREYQLNIMTLCFPLPKTSDALYTHLNHVVDKDVAQKWLKPRSPKLV